MTQSTATAPGPASAAQAGGLVRFAEGKKHQARGRPCVFHSVAQPHRSDGYASGALGRETPQLRDLTPSHALIAVTAGAHCPTGKPHQPSRRRYVWVMNKPGSVRTVPDLQGSNIQDDKAMAAVGRMSEICLKRSSRTQFHNSGRNLRCLRDGFGWSGRQRWLIMRRWLVIGVILKRIRWCLSPW